MHVATKFRFVVSTIGLVMGGIVLIVLGQLFHSEVGKVELDRLVSEVGALLLVVGSLHLQRSPEMTPPMLARSDPPGAERGR